MVISLSPVGKGRRADTWGSLWMWALARRQMRCRSEAARLVRGTFLAAFGLAVACRAWAQQNSMLQAQGCPRTFTDVPALSPDSIGPLGLSEPMGRLRQLCGAARDTAIQREGGGGPLYPGLILPFDSLTVIALQYGVSTLDSSRAADGWIVLGARATIQRKVPLSARWSVLQPAMGVAQASARSVLLVRFCSFPNAVLTLATDPRALVITGGRVDLSSIPPDATIHHVFIMSRSLAGHLLGC